MGVLGGLKAGDLDSDQDELGGEDSELLEESEEGIAIHPGTALNLRTTTSQKCAVITRRAHI